MRTRALLVLFILLLSSPFWIVAKAAGQDLAVAAHTQPPPDELAVDLKPLLNPGGATVKVRATTIDLWFVKQIRVKAATGATVWSSVAEGVLVGAMRVSGTYADIRGRAIKPGVYTLRFALQPEDKDHLAVSPHREFLLVSPGASDTNAVAAGHDATVELAKQTTGIAHPGVLGWIRS